MNESLCLYGYNSLLRASANTFAFHRQVVNAYNTTRCLCWCVSGSWGSNCGEASFPATAMVTQSKLSKVDSVRERELFRYYSPTDSTAAAPSPPHGVPKDVDANTLSAHQASSPDTTLTALAQLCALRLHASRAMIRWVSYQDFGLKR